MKYSQAICPKKKKSRSSIKIKTKRVINYRKNIYYLRGPYKLMVEKSDLYLLDKSYLRIYIDLNFISYEQILN